MDNKARYKTPGFVSEADKLLDDIMIDRVSTMKIEDYVQQPHLDNERVKFLNKLMKAKDSLKNNDTK